MSLHGPPSTWSQEPKQEIFGIIVGQINAKFPAGLLFSNIPKHLHCSPDMTAGVLNHMGDILPLLKGNPLVLNRKCGDHHIAAQARGGGAWMHLTREQLNMLSRLARWRCARRSPSHGSRERFRPEGRGRSVTPEETSAWPGLSSWGMQRQFGNCQNYFWVTHTHIYIYIVSISLVIRSCVRRPRCWIWTSKLSHDKRF